MKTLITAFSVILFAVPFSAFANSNSRTLVVKSGDTLGRLAMRHGTTVDALMKANNLKNPDRLFAGQKLAIPTTDVAPERAEVDSSQTPEVKVSAAREMNRSPSNHAEQSSSRRHVEKYVLLKHWVRDGETVGEIAETYGVTALAIIETNGIRRPNKVPAGMVLWIPRKRTRAPQVRAMKYFNGLKKSGTDKLVKGTTRRIPSASLPKNPPTRRLARPKRQHRLGTIISP